MTLEEELNLSELVPSAEEQSPLTNPDFHIASYHTEFPKDPFTEGVIPHYNPPLTNPLGPMII